MPPKGLFSLKNMVRDWFLFPRGRATRTGGPDIGQLVADTARDLAVQDASWIATRQFLEEYGLGLEPAIETAPKSGLGPCTCHKGGFCIWHTPIAGAPA